jgi:putative ABC transport system permease protein
MREGSDGHDDASVTTDMRGVSPNYFQALGLRLLRGRAFTAADSPNAPQVAIISRGVAKRLYADADPIGRRISNGSVEKPNWREIVGVVDDMRSNGPGDEPPLTLYMPSSTWVNGQQTFIIRGNVPVTTLLPQIRRTVSSIDPLLALSNVSTIEESLRGVLAMPHFTMLLLTLLGGTGLVLAVVGVYGVISYFVTQRTHEFGVRLALGASSNAVQWLVVRQGLLLAGVGMIVGCSLAFVAARMLQSLVFGITPHDPLTFVSVAALLAAVAIAASYLPARRATRIDPLEALRS